MADTDVKYENKTVTTVRGTEARSIAKWESEGWEFVSQSPARLLRSTLTFRRPKKSIPKWAWAIGASVVGALGIVVIIAAIHEGSTGTNKAIASPTSATATATHVPSAQPSTSSEPDVLTVKNNADLATLLKVKDPGDPAVGEFAEKYIGKTIEFDGNVVALSPHNDTKTLEDVLIYCGNYSTTTAAGPAFRIEGASMYNLPGGLAVGNNVRVTAEVSSYEEAPGFFKLLPFPITVSIRD